MKEPVNKYKCSPKVWKKFDLCEKVAFNETYKNLSGIKMLAFAPDMTMSTAQYNTYLHNVSCQVAWDIKTIIAKANGIII